MLKYYVKKYCRIFNTPFTQKTDSLRRLLPQDSITTIIFVSYLKQVKDFIVKFLINESFLPEKRYVF